MGIFAHLLWASVFDRYVPLYKFIIASFQMQHLLQVQMVSIKSVHFVSKKQKKSNSNV